MSHIADSSTAVSFMMLSGTTNRMYAQRNASLSQHLVFPKLHLQCSLRPNTNGSFSEAFGIRALLAAGLSISAFLARHDGHVTQLIEAHQSRVNVKQCQLLQSQSMLPSKD